MVRFSVVIPTRDRPHTLVSTLQTCRLQKFADAEFLVSDNHSQANIRAIVASLGDSRFRYVRTPKPLAISDSWDFAVGQAKGQFITVLGDDDGLMLHSLPEIDRLIRLADAQVLRWDSILYCWPDLPQQNCHEPNSMLVHLKMGHPGHVIERRRSIPMMQAAVHGDVCYTQLPMIYCSMIHRDLLDEMRHKAGCLFTGRTQDVYSGFSIAYLAESYHSIDAPMTINGLSGNSTGIARHCMKAPSEIDREFRRLNAAAGHALHPWVPDLRPLSLAVVDSFLHAQKRLFADNETLALDRKRMIAHCLNEIRPENQEEWGAALSACRATLLDDPNLLCWFDDTQAGRPLPPPWPGPGYRRYGGHYLHLNAADWGVKELVGAAELCERLLGYERDGVNAVLRESDANETPDLNELQAKEAVIQTLRTAAEERLQTIHRLTAQLQAVLEKDRMAREQAAGKGRMSTAW
jgi:Glycosyl transferase family 2